MVAAGGSKPTARVKVDEVRQLKSIGLSLPEICRRLDIGRSSAYRVLQAR
jgi:DNA invertase Pin-like site-specific DNA recombinase